MGRGIMFIVCDDCGECYDEKDIAFDKELEEHACPVCRHVFSEDKVIFDGVFHRARFLFPTN